MTDYPGSGGGYGGPPNHGEQQPGCGQQPGYGGQQPGYEQQPGYGQPAYGNPVPPPGYGPPKKNTSAPSGGGSASANTSGFPSSQACAGGSSTGGDLSSGGGSSSLSPTTSTHMTRLSCQGYRERLTTTDLNRVTSATDSGPAKVSGSTATGAGRVVLTDGTSRTVTITMTQQPDEKWCVSGETAMR